LSNTNPLAAVAARYRYLRVPLFAQFVAPTSRSAVAWASWPTRRESADSLDLKLVDLELELPRLLQPYKSQPRQIASVRFKG